MAFSVAAMNIGDCEIDDAQSINKSYPSFLMILIILEVRLMSSEFGNKIKLSIFGESHGEAIGCVIDSIPAGVKLDMEKYILIWQGVLRVRTKRLPQGLKRIFLIFSPVC